MIPPPGLPVEPSDEAMPEPGHILIDSLTVAADVLRKVSVDQSSEEGRTATAAYWLKYLDERGFILVPDPRKPSLDAASRGGEADGIGG